MPHTHTHTNTHKLEDKASHTFSYFKFIYFREYKERNETVRNSQRLSM
uniref:Uncharacterized protein n=1 Tax=Anguilla anguilla TaxID=7936 RepID=A0A0E9Q834_ANGAN